MTLHQPFRPIPPPFQPFPPCTIPIFMPPFAPSLPHPPPHDPHALNKAHIPAFTVPRFYDFTHSQKRAEN